MKKFALKYPRIGGGFFLCFGLALLYLHVYVPLQQAESGAERIALSSKLILVGIVAAAAGIIGLILGPRAVSIFHPENGQRGFGAKITVFVACILGTIAYLVLKSHLETKGYTFH